MLALSPLPPQTDGERAFLAELARWDTGAAVRAAVVASLPLTDGPLNRRLSDAVLFVPEGVAVVRVVEVVRQSGVVTASPEGAWTIGAEGRPGEVLQLSGGGSTPLDGLMRAGMDVAVRLRRAGLEPGRIARLTVLVGDVTGLVPADGDLGEGDHVALLDTRSLLLGIARASRYAGIDNPRLWTTADVRAGLEAIGLQGRGPSVQELNGEGFPYSPYVLRRPELMAPAAMAAMAAAGTVSAETPPTAPPLAPAMPPPAPVGPEPTPQPQAPPADPDATRVGAAGGQPRVEAVAPPQPVPPQPIPPQAVPQQPAPLPSAAAVPVQPRTRDTVNIDAPLAPPDDGGGIGGLFANGEQITGPTEPPRTSVFAQPPAQYPAAGASSAPSWGAAPPVHDSGVQQGGGGGPSRRALLILAAVLIAVLVLGVGIWLVTRGGSDQTATGGAAPSTAPQQAAGPKPGDVQTAGGVPFTVEAVQVDKSCGGHAYGQVGDYLQATNCTGLARALYSGQLDKGAIVVSVIRVRMPDAATARELRALADRNGSGNVSDLLREGVRYSGSPAQLSHEEYASAVSGSSVTIVETSWVDAAARGSSTAIDVAATNGLALKTPPFPGG